MLSIGSTFAGKYEIVALLGEGSFGRVYKGRQLSTGQAVAIKVLRFWEGDAPGNVENQIARFRREMRLCAGLWHTNVVRLIDSGESEQGILYAVFEYVPGVTLRKVLDTEGKLGMAETLHLLTQVLDALSCAHARGVVHRDLKPENILITRTGARRNALVLDLGLGGFTREAEGWALPRITATHELMGTPCYAAPEQLRGEPPSPRSDLYSWGLICLECLTGEVAVGGGSSPDVILKQLGPDPVPIASWLREQRLGRLLEVLTAKEVERRDLTIERLLEELSVIQRGAMPYVAGGARGEQLPATERRLTVLSCRMVAGRLDPEELREILGAYYAACSEAIDQYDGLIAQHLGDGILAYFGYPRAHEDNAQRAVLAGLAIQTALRRLAPDVAARHGIELTARVGLHTGGVVILEIPGARPETQAVGDAISIAAHVQAAAEPGAVLITADTQRLVAGSFMVAEGSAQPIEGVPEPITLYRVERLVGVRSRLPSPGLAPFVGRMQERRLLMERWGRAREGGGQVVLLTGEPGIGKSRLVEQFRLDLGGTPHTWVAVGASRYEQHTPFALIRSLFQRAFAWPPDLPAADRLSQIEITLGVGGPLSAEAAPLLAGLLEVPVGDRYPPLLMSPEQRRRKLIAVLVAKVCFLAEQQPLVLALDDLQWADPSTLETLGLLAGQIAAVPILMLLTARPEFRAPWPARGDSIQITLSGLSRQELRELVAGVMSCVPPDDVLEVLAKRTDGVPLFAEELARAVVGEHTAALDEIPVSLQDSLLARIDRLGPAKDVAQVASVLGREFPYVLLRAVAGLSDMQLEASLAALTEAELLYARGLPPHATYVFKHALVQQAAYDSLLKRPRRELHARVAEMLIGRVDGLPEPPPEVIAQHWTAAGEAERAVAAWQEAGERASLRSAYAEAIAHFTHALETLGSVPDAPRRTQSELELQLRLGSAIQMGKGFAAPEVVQALARARALSEQIGDTQERFSVLIGLWSLFMNRGELHAAQEVAEEMLRAGEKQGDAALVSWGHAARAGARVNLGDLGGALDCARRARGVYLGEERGQLVYSFPLGQALLYGGLAAALLGLPDQARACCDEMDALTARLSEDPVSRPIALVSCCVIKSWLRDFDMVRRHADELLHDAEERMLPIFAAWARIYGGWADALGGRPDEGIPQLRQGLAEHLASGQRLGVAQYLTLLAEAQLAAGAIGDGLASVDDALACTLSQEQLYHSELLRLRAALKNAAGVDAAAVEAGYREASAVASRMGAKLPELRATTDLACLLVAHGRPAEARRLLAPLYASFTEGFDTPDLRAAAAMLAGLPGSEATVLEPP